MNKPVQYYRRTSLMLTKEQHDGLHERLVIYRASDPSITQSDVIRDAIDRYLGEVRQKEELKNGKTI
jgi:hypothetical protein